MKEKIDIVFDMETGDPDDLWTLYFLLSHPRVNLKAVTVVPGSPEQIGLVKSVLKEFRKEADVGSNDPDSPYELSRFYKKHYGNIERCYNKVFAKDVLILNCDNNTVLLTGGPPKNMQHILDEDVHLGRWVAQGGFAGDNIVPRHLVMEKFKGMKTCPTFNLNGAPKVTEEALVSSKISERYFVSKNVCHSVVYDEEMDWAFKNCENKNSFVEMMIRVMPHYLGKGNHKKIHDLLAAVCAIDLSIGTFVSVELYRENGKWGSRYSETPNCQIIIDYDKEKFLYMLLGEL